MYISRVDGDAVTCDIRVTKPNSGSYIPGPVRHTPEHLFAAYARNSSFGSQRIYVDPMGCRTGFYFSARDSLSHQQALDLV